MVKGGKKITLTCSVCGKEFKGPAGLMKNAMKRHEASCKAKKELKEGQGGKPKEIKEEGQIEENSEDVIDDDESDQDDEEEEPALVKDNEEEGQIIEYDDDEDERIYECESCGANVSEGQIECHKCKNPMNWEGL